MVNPDSERKPDDKERRGSPSGTTYDLLRVLLAGGTAVFALGVIASTVFGQYPFTFVYGILVILFAYLFYRFGRKGPSRAGQDFNL